MKSEETRKLKTDVSDSDSDIAGEGVELSTVPASDVPAEVLRKTVDSGAKGPGQETGAPDWVTEVVSPSSKKLDYSVKLFKYRKAGVREYWIINTEKRIVLVYSWTGGQESVNMYSFEDEIPAGIYPDLRIRLSDFV